MAIKVVPAGEADAPRIVVIEKVAFGPNPISGALYPGPFPDGNSHLETKNINELRASPHCRWMKAVDEELEAQGKEGTVATASWYFWDIPLTHEMLPPDGQYGPGANQECCELFFGGMKRNMLKWFEGKKVARKLYTLPFVAERETISWSMFLTNGRLETPPDSPGSSEAWCRCSVAKGRS